MKRKLISITLMLSMIVSLAATAYANEPPVADNNVSSSNGELLVRYNDDGSVYLEDSLTGENVVAVFRYNSDGELSEVDLVEYAAEENKRQMENKHLVVENVDPIVMGDAVVSPMRADVATYSYKETDVSFETYGNWERVSTLSTFDADNLPGKMYVENSITVGDEFGGSLSISIPIKNEIRGGASFTWNRSLQSSMKTGSEWPITKPGTYYIAFRPLYYETLGEVTKTIINTETGLTQSSGPYMVWGRCPAKMNGAADGEYKVMKR